MSKRDRTLRKKVRKLQDHIYALQRTLRKERGKKPVTDYRDHHHMTAKANGGADTTKNLLLLWRERHEAYHSLFGNLGLEQAIELLIRVHRAKHRCKNKWCPYCQTLMPRDQKWSS